MDANIATPLIGRGHVWHRRLSPTVHSFRYPSYFTMIPMRSWSSHGSPGLARNKPGMLSFYDCDHGRGNSDALQWLDEVLRNEGCNDADGEIWLQTYPRVLGYVFKPVSFWYAYRKDGTLAAIVVEVNNTFGERHCYFLPEPSLTWSSAVKAHKVFHVSPFCSVEGDYFFRFYQTPEALCSTTKMPKDAPATRSILVRIDLHQDNQALLQTSFGGRLEPCTTRSSRNAFFNIPLMTLGVVARIHWQALKLLLKRVPFLRKPPPPQQFVTR